MFARIKKSGRYEYLQIVQSMRIDGKPRQRVIATLGRLDQLQASGQLDDVLRSTAKFSERLAILEAADQADFQAGASLHIGPPLVFDRLWKELGIGKVIDQMLSNRKFEFPMQRAIFVTVLHRLMVSGSDRAAEQWCRRYAINGASELELHHFYRAMGWLGEEIDGDNIPIDNTSEGKTPARVRCRKDQLEEHIFQQRRNLFTGIELVFFDTTSLYFEGDGGESIGQYGYSKDHRPDLKQVVVGVVMDDSGYPICSELLPGNTADITTLIPVIDRLKQRFGISNVCIVADRGMISNETISKLEARNIRYILGARLRAVKEIREQVLSRGGRYHEVNPGRKKSKDPSPLKVKEVRVDDHRYIVCHNEEQARKDQADRQAILLKLKDQLKQGAKSLVGNKGYRKYLCETKRGAFAIDQQKIKSEARFDGKWVLRTDTEIPPAEVALKYKELLHVETIFRNMKTALQTRPIYHKCDDTIRGHLFCSFLALLLMKELQRRMEDRGWKVQWRRLLDDLDELQELTLQSGGKKYTVRTATTGEAGKAIQAAGVALGPTIRQER